MEVGVRELRNDTTRVIDAVRDTSVFIARETERPLGPLPDRVAVSVVTIGEAVMSAWARLVAHCRRAGVHWTIRLTDALIAATAIAYGLPVVAQDDDFDRIAGAHATLRVIRA